MLVGERADSLLPDANINTKSAGQGTGLQPSLIYRLYAKRKQFQTAIDRIDNTLRVLEANEQTAQVVEAVLAAQQKINEPIL